MRLSGRVENVSLRCGGGGQAELPAEKKPRGEGGGLDLLPLLVKELHHGELPHVEPHCVALPLSQVVATAICPSFPCQGQVSVLTINFISKMTIKFVVTTNNASRVVEREEESNCVRSTLFKILVLCHLAPSLRKHHRHRHGKHKVQAFASSWNCTNTAPTLRGPL